MKETDKPNKRSYSSSASGIATTTTTVTTILSNKETCHHVYFDWNFYFQIEHFVKRVFHVVKKMFYFLYWLIYPNVHLEWTSVWSCRKTTLGSESEVTFLVVGIGMYVHLLKVSQYHHVLIGLEPWKLSEHTGSGSEDVTFMCNGLELASLPAVCHSWTYL